MLRREGRSINSPADNPSIRPAARRRREAADASAPAKIDLKHCGDRALVEACLAGGEDAWEELVCRYGPLVFSYNSGGTALYTSFHNEAQATADMDRLIEEFVFSL